MPGAPPGFAHLHYLLKFTFLIQVKSSLYYILLLIAWLSGRSQAPVKNLEGRWESTGKKTDSSLIIKPGNITKQIVQFSSNRTFRRVIYFRDPKNRADTISLKGDYKADYRKNTVFFRSDLDEVEGSPKSITPTSYTSRVQFLNDTSIVLLNNIYYKRKRADNNPLSANLENGSRNFYLQKLSDANRTIRIPKDQVMLRINESKRKGDHISRFNSTYCILAGIKKDSVIVRMVSEEIDSEYRDHFTTSINNYFQDLMSRKYKSVAMSDISYIAMKSPFRRGMSGFGRVLMGLSILTILSTPIVGLSVPESERSALREQVFFDGFVR